MKRFGLALAAVLIAGVAQADVISGSASGASSQVDVVTGSAAGVNITNNGQLPGEDNRTYSSIETAPSLGGLALGGGHPCAFSPATAQFSIVGGGAGIGGMKIDEACMLMVMGAAGDAKAYNAALYMIAARDYNACVAMKASGIVAECIESSGNPLRPRPQPRVSTMNSDVLYSRCAMEDGAIRVAVKRGADRTAAIDQCKASLGY